MKFNYDDINTNIKSKFMNPKIDNTDKILAKIKEEEEEKFK